MISTLKYNQEEVGRIVGNTTRQVNFAVEKILQGEEVICEDHFENGGNKRINRLLFDRVLRRLAIEHSGVIVEKDFVKLIIKKVN
jgi:hypothetical protein